MAICWGRMYREAVHLERAGELCALGPAQPRKHWSESLRHRTGAFYTPTYIVDFVITHTLVPTVLELRSKASNLLVEGNITGFRQLVSEATRLRVADPACGCGRFLLAAFRVLRALHVWLAKQEAGCVSAPHSLSGVPQVSEAGSQTYERNRNPYVTGTLRALACLHGTDLNAEAISTTRAILAHAAGVSELDAITQAEITEILASSVCVADGLAYEVEKRHIAYPWHIVVGNPPWGAAGANTKLAHRMGLSAANANTFTLFLLSCLQKVAPGGRLGLVLPRNFCKGNDYAQGRERLLQEAAIEWLGDAGQAFPGVTQEAVVIVARRLHNKEKASKNINVVHMKAETNNAVWNSHQVPQAFFAQAPGHVITLRATITDMAILTRMQQKSGGTLRDFVTWARGLEYGQDGTLIRCPKCSAYTSVPKKKQAAKACPACGETLSGLVADYSLLARSRDVTHTVPIYVGRHVRRYSLAQPYWIDPSVPGVHYKDHSLFTGDKILLPKIAPFIAAALDLTDSWTTQGVYILRPVNSLFNNWDVYSLLGLINSAPLAFYYQFRYNDGASLTTNVTLANILDLPLPATDDNQSLECIRQGARCLTNVDNAQLPLTNSEELSLAIDLAACRLYQLAEADVQHIMAWRLNQREDGVNHD